MGQFCNYYYYNFYTCSSGAPDVERSQDQQLDGQSEFWFGVQNFFFLQRLPQKSSAALHAADTNTRLLSLKTKERNQWWPSFYQTGKHSLPPTNSNTPHQALFTENNILLIRLYPSLWIYSQLMKYLHRSWRESYNHGSLFLYYTHILCQSDSGEFPRRPSVCPSVRHPLHTCSRWFIIDVRTFYPLLLSNQQTRGGGCVTF